VSCDLRERLRDHLRDAALFPEPGLAIVAVSGGPDSVAMLDLLAGLSAELALELVVAHIDHGIAPTSGDVARDVEALTSRYGLPCHVVRLRLGPEAGETAARKARYRELRRLQRALGARYLVTAHHRDDQAETVLFRLLKGSGVAGLAGIPRQGPRGLVRPLLPFGRADLLAWLDRSRDPRGSPLAAHQDPANADPRHDRSWLRHHVLPLADERFGGGVAERLARVARSARDDRAAWAAALRQVPELGFRAEADGVALDRTPLGGYDNVLSEALLRALAREVGCSLGPRAGSRLLDFVRSGRSGSIMELGHGWEAEISFDRVRIVRPISSTGLLPVECGVGPEGVVRWGRWEFAWRACAAGRPERSGMVTWLTPGAATVRGVGAGDRLVPLGGVGRRKVRRLLMESRVSFRERAAYPVLERCGIVLWVPGVCRSHGDLPSQGQDALWVEARNTVREPAGAVGD
jgi:tRNA(Ile)-lysidine synthase